MPFAHKRFGGNGNITHCCKSLQKTTTKFSSNPRTSFLRKSTRKDPPVKSDQNKAISVHVLWGSFRHRSIVPCNEPGRSIPYCAQMLHSHRAIFNLEQVHGTPSRWGGGGGLHRLINLQTVRLPIIATIMHHLAVRHRTMLNSISFSF